MRDVVLPPEEQWEGNRKKYEKPFVLLLDLDDTAGKLSSPIESGPPFGPS